MTSPFFQPPIDCQDFPMPLLGTQTFGHLDYDSLTTDVITEFYNISMNLVIQFNAMRIDSWAGAAGCYGTRTLPQLMEDLYWLVNVHFTTQFLSCCFCDD